MNWNGRCVQVLEKAIIDLIEDRAIQVAPYEERSEDGRELRAIPLGLRSDEGRASSDLRRAGGQPAASDAKDAFQDAQRKGFPKEPG